MPLRRFLAFLRATGRGPADPSVIGLAWYREDQWPLLRDVSKDVDHLEKTFEEWSMHAQRRYDELVHEGQTLRKVAVDVEDLVRWCTELGRDVDREGRSAYVKYRLEDEKRGAQLPKKQKRRSRLS